MTRHQDVIVSNKQLNRYGAQPRFQNGCIVVRNLCLVVVTLVALRAEVEVGQVTRPDHLRPMHNILGGGTAEIVICHHRYSVDVNVILFVKAAEAAGDPP